MNSLAKVCVLFSLDMFLGYWRTASWLPTLRQVRLFADFRKTNLHSFLF